MNKLSVDELDDLFDTSSSGEAPPGIRDDQRDVDELLVEGVGVVERAMITEFLAVIGCEDDHGLVGDAQA